MRISNSLPKLALAALAMAMLATSGVMMPALAKTPAVAAPHVRLLPLEGGRNFRDLGGYAAANGRHVKWGMLFRSGSMHGLTEADYAYLMKRGIRVVCDLRDTRERAAEPVSWPVKGAPRVLSDDYQLDNASFMPAGDMKSWTAEQARAAMAASYPRMLVQFNGQYKRMFAELLAGHVPLAFNCSAGKDRTGIAAALLLTSLGVSRETVIEDYLLTNTYLNADKLMTSKSMAGTPYAQIPPETMKAMLAADRSYIEAALKILDTHKGGAMGWLQDEMGLTSADITKLRRAYLS